MTTAADHTADEGVVLDVPAQEFGEVTGVVSHLRTTAAAPPVVDEPAVGDGEDPGAQRVLGAAEPGQPGEDADEGLAGEVVGLDGAVQAQVTGDRRGQVAVEHLERPAGPGLRGGEDVVERQSCPHTPSLARSSSLSSSAGARPDCTECARSEDAPTIGVPSGRSPPPSR